ncbi:uncharacterized protein TRIVIDRAFT_227445 [Trichoderma virens Gv29-8]|uniref:Uncharacterized protein n=1 Tax=Hypocrea virens (strain Gv29-8 / FGSC 10586) TaxID=413071 RepID=G9N9H2_HYPVG|nr:uncharacterized protein TRIVIDRAFT_227445 [Trichoderma virens Gv29-8]EHK16592.1 hypothetical protein TRIVIDRAFT_227445 [Trichoderma virens Gv29-8]UKZ52031.1 hypothetical protein TrVGV298_005798 [Trichoderma virens]
MGSGILQQNRRKGHTEGAKKRRQREDEMRDAGDDALATLRNVLVPRRKRTDIVRGLVALAYQELVGSPFREALRKIWILAESQPARIDGLGTDRAFPEVAPSP